MSSKPDIVLIHGFWVTPRSWEEVADYALAWALEHAEQRSPA
jgi:hypothetical protein